jgi:hypothetical protein
MLFDQLGCWELLARCHPGMRSASGECHRDQCKSGRVPFYIKQWGGFPKDKLGGELDGKEDKKFSTIQELRTPSLAERRRIEAELRKRDLDCQSGRAGTRHRFCCSPVPEAVPDWLNCEGIDLPPEDSHAWPAEHARKYYPYGSFGGFAQQRLFSFFPQPHPFGGAQRVGLWARRVRQSGCETASPRSRARSSRCPLPRAAMNS